MHENINLDCPNNIFFLITDIVEICLFWSSCLFLCYFDICYFQSKDLLDQEMEIFTKQFWQWHDHGTVIIPLMKINHFKMNESLVFLHLTVVCLTIMDYNSGVFVSSLNKTSYSLMPVLTQININYACLSQCHSFDILIWKLIKASWTTVQ